MNWLERARRAIPKSARRRTANSAERNLTAVTAVPHLALLDKLRASIGSNGSAPNARIQETHLPPVSKVPEGGFEPDGVDTEERKAIALLASSEPGFSEPWPPRRGRIESEGHMLLHFCCVCGAWGSYGFGVNLRGGRMGRWFCAAHRAHGRTAP